MNKEIEFLQEFEKIRKNELIEEISLKLTPNLDGVTQLLLNAVAFFVLEHNFNQKIDNYFSIDNIWEFFIKKIEEFLKLYTFKAKTSNVLTLKKCLHYVSIVLHEQNLENFSIEILSSKQ